MTLKADQVPEVDRLDRTRFAKEIADNIILYLQKNQESLVIGIHGPWGSGKSTLLHYIKKEIKISRNVFLPEEEENRSILSKLNPFKRNQVLNILEFNPWMFSGKEELHTIFLNELAVNVGSQKLRKRLKSISKKLAWVGEASKFWLAFLKLIGQWSNISLDNLKKATNEVLIKKNIRIVVIMDDLDRLAPSEILEIFQLIKLNANFKNTVFLISFDKSVVIESIKNQYNFDGEKYLEKIVQVDYSLPSILPEDIESMFYERLEDLLKIYEIDFRIEAINVPWLIDGLKHYFKNVRDLNRYFNSLNFRLPTFHKNVNVLDFLIIEAIRLFDYQSYELIRSNYKESIQFGDQSQFHHDLGEIRESKSNDLYKYLFEKGNPNSRKDRNYRISDPEFFDRYFSLSVSKKDMREEEFMNFIEHREIRPALLENIIVNGKIEFLLRRLTTKSVIPANVDQTGLISALISVWDRHHKEFVNNWRAVWDALKVIISTSNDQNLMYRSLIDELNVSTQEFSPARFVYIWFLLLNIDPKDGDNIDYDLLPFAELLKSRKESLERYFKLILENYRSYFFCNNSYSLLYQRIFLPSFAKYHPERYKEYFKQMISDDQKIFKILDMMVVRDSTTQTPFGIDPKYTSVLLPGSLKDDFENRLNEINLKTIPKEEGRAIEAYLNYLKDLKGKS